jgi:hypothetical protein
MPALSARSGVYLGGRPFAKDLYVGMFTELFLNRRRGHDAQCTSNSKETLDKAHAKMRKFGISRYLFCPFGDRPRRPELTRLYWRGVEDRAMTLLPINMNTQGQSVRGADKVHVAF